MCRIEELEKTTEVMHAGSNSLPQSGCPSRSGQEAGKGCREPAGSNPLARLPIPARASARQRSQRRQKACDIWEVGREAKLMWHML